MDYKLTDIERILKFWFGEITDGLTVEDRNDFWFMANNQIDISIKYEFEHLVIKAGDGKLSGWEGSAKGSLALIILLDQFPRNIYRGTPKAFQFDGYARRICKKGLLEEKDKELELIQRCFYYLPLEHSEDIKDQDMCVALYQNMKEYAKKQHLKQIKHAIKYAEIHRDIIKKFGRFPHRNKILSRNTTEAELKFLSKEAISFGQ